MFAKGVRKYQNSPKTEPWYFAFKSRIARVNNTFRKLKLQADPLDYRPPSGHRKGSNGCTIHVLSSQIG